MQRLHTFSLEQIMVYVNIPTDALRHSRAAQELIAEGRLEGRQEGRQQGEALGEAKATLRQLTHRCGPLSPATTARIQALPLERLEALGLALLELDFSGAEDLTAWLEAHAG
jgi:predicted transposase YdaD